MNDLLDRSTALSFVVDVGSGIGRVAQGDEHHRLVAGRHVELLDEGIGVEPFHRTAGDTVCPRGIHKCHRRQRTRPCRPRLAVGLIHAGHRLNVIQQRVADVRVGDILLGEPVIEDRLGVGHRIGVSEHNDGGVGVDDMFLPVGNGFQSLLGLWLPKGEKLPGLEVVARGCKRRRLEDIVKRRLIDRFVAVVVY